MKYLKNYKFKFINTDFLYLRIMIFIQFINYNIKMNSFNLILLISKYDSSSRSRLKNQRFLCNVKNKEVDTPLM